MIPKTRPTKLPGQGRGWSRTHHPADEGLTLTHYRCGCGIPIRWTTAGLVAVWQGREKYLGGSVVAAESALNRMKCPRCGKTPRRKQPKLRYEGGK